MKRELIMQVRELMERHLDVIDIASRLRLDVPTVMSILEIIKGTLQ